MACFISLWFKSTTGNDKNPIQNHDVAEVCNYLVRCTNLFRSECLGVLHIKCNFLWKIFFSSAWNAKQYCAHVWPALSSPKCQIQLLWQRHRSCWKLTFVLPATLVDYCKLSIYLGCFIKQPFVWQVFSPSESRPLFCLLQMFCVVAVPHPEPSRYVVGQRVSLFTVAGVLAWLEDTWNQTVPKGNLIMLMCAVASLGHLSALWTNSELAWGIFFFFSFE